MDGNSIETQSAQYTSPVLAPRVLPSSPHSCPNGQFGVFASGLFPVP